MGLIARIVEEGGISTISLSSAREEADSVTSTQSVSVNFPLGNTTGKPFDRDLQVAIIKDACDALKSSKEPGTIVDLPLSPFTAQGLAECLISTTKSLKE